MQWPDILLLIGMFVCLAGAFLAVPLIRRQLGWIREHPRRSSKRLESMSEIAIPAVPLAGILLLQFANLADHVREETLPQNIWLTIGSGSGLLLIFGMQLGRLLMRWQLQHLGGLLDTKSGVVRDQPAESR